MLLVEVHAVLEIQIYAETIWKYIEYILIAGSVNSTTYPDVSRAFGPELGRDTNQTRYKSLGQRGLSSVCSLQPRCGPTDFCYLGDSMLKGKTLKQIGRAHV